MPKTKLQNIIFTLIMAFVMVYAMVCYNIALDKEGMILEYFVVEKLSQKLAFRMVSPEDKPIFITLAISSMIVCLVCPVMSFIATCLFMHPGNQIIALWLQKTVQNFPMALCWQIFFAGPGVRNAFGFVVGKSCKKQEK